MPRMQGAELKLVSCVLGTGPALSPTSARVGCGPGPGEGGTFFSATWSAREETQATSPFSAISRGFPRRQEARDLGALGKAARPRPSACALAPGRAGQCRGEGWLVAGPGRAPRNADKDPGHGLGNH